MGNKVATRYQGFDILKVLMAYCVAERHLLQFLMLEEGALEWLIVRGLSSMAVPLFFVMSGFFLFRKLDGTGDFKRVRDYAIRIIRLYVIWSVIYFPLDLYYGCIAPGLPVGPWMKYYVRAFLFCSNAFPLWYLPALACAVLFIWFLNRSNIRTELILAAGAVLYVYACIVDNYHVNVYLTGFLKQFSRWYTNIFMTTRNGFFYGTYFVGLGLYLAKKKYRPTLLMSIAGSVLSVGIALFEAKKLDPVNMLMSSMLVAYFVFCLFEKFRFEGDGPAVKTVNIVSDISRSLSQWVYLSHELFIFATVYVYGQIIPRIMPGLVLGWDAKTFSVIYIILLTAVTLPLAILCYFKKFKYLKLFI